MKFATLGSGSAGNSIIIDDGASRLLVDVGFSSKQIERRLQMLGISAESLDGILITHEHIDHIRGLRVFLKKRGIPVFTTKRTHAAFPEDLQLAKIDWRFFEASQIFEHLSFKIHSFSVTHDAADPVGFRIESGEKSLAIATDIGFATALVRSSIQGVNGLFLEMNYDKILLEQDTLRPWSVKQRIASRHGHLSNDEAIDLLKLIAHEELSHVLIGHLSSDCNTPEHVMKAVDLAFETQRFRPNFHCAPQHCPTPWIDLRIAK